MNYIIKVLTPEFKELVDQWVDNQLMGLAGKKREENKKNTMAYLRSFWKGELTLKADSTKFANNEEYQVALRSYYGRIAEPDYVTLCVSDMSTLMEPSVKVMWNGERIWLHEVPNVIEYKIADKRTPLSGVSKRLS